MAPRRPRGVSYALTPSWLASARALSGALGAKLILGLNLAAADPRLTAAEAEALLSGVGAANVSALELGNEPDVYGVFPWYRDHGKPVFARSAGYGLQARSSPTSAGRCGPPPAVRDDGRSGHGRASLAEPASRRCSAASPTCTW